MAQGQRRVYDLRHFCAGPKPAQNQRNVCSWVHDGIDGYRGIHAGVTKSGVKKGENRLTRLTAADCSDDGKWRDDIDTVNKLSSRFGWVVARINLSSGFLEK